VSEERFLPSHTQNFFCTSSITDGSKTKQRENLHHRASSNKPNLGKVLERAVEGRWSAYKNSRTIGRWKGGGDDSKLATKAWKDSLKSHTNLEAGVVN